MSYRQPSILRHLLPGDARPAVATPMWRGSVAAEQSALWSDEATPMRLLASAPEPLHCTLRFASLDSGLRALLTGLEMLESTGRVALTLEPQDGSTVDPAAPWHLRDKSKTEASLRVGGGRSAVLDVHDSWEVDPRALQSHDLYFKRSLRADSVLMEGGSRLRALGLLSAVHLDGFSQHEFRYLRHRAPAREDDRRPDATIGRVGRWAARIIANRLGAGNRLTVPEMSAPPGPTGPARVLLMAGLWDPTAVPESCQTKRAEFEQINETRVQCVRALRAAFGARFTGGIVPTPYAQGRCPDVLLPSMAAASPRQFIAQARRHAVCVTSTGLHGSNGFRLAELASLSRAIVSEPLRYEVPGPFRQGSHYLSYNSPEECVERVGRLLAHEAERMEMMHNNAQYYAAWLRPDRLAARVVALLQCGSTVVRSHTTGPLARSVSADTELAGRPTVSAPHARDHGAQIKP